MSDLKDALLYLMTSAFRRLVAVLRCIPAVLIALAAVIGGSSVLWIAWAGTTRVTVVNETPVPMRNVAFYGQNSDGVEKASWTYDLAPGESKFKIMWGCCSLMGMRLEIEDRRQETSCPYPEWGHTAIFKFVLDENDGEPWCKTDSVLFP